MQNLGRLIANRGPDRSLALWAGGLNERRPSADRADTQWVLGVRLLLSSAGRPRQRTAVVSGTRERVGGTPRGFAAVASFPCLCPERFLKAAGCGCPGRPPTFGGEGAAHRKGGPSTRPGGGPASLGAQPVAWPSEGVQGPLDMSCILTPCSLTMMSRLRSHVEN